MHCARSSLPHWMRMKSDRIVSVIILVLVVAVIVWVARHTYWADQVIPMPLQGEAATNPFYVPERFAQALGARAQWNRELTLPPTTGVIFLSRWNWDLSPDRQHRIEQWVAAGGR